MPLPRVRDSDGIETVDLVSTKRACLAHFCRSSPVSLLFHFISCPVSSGVAWRCSSRSVVRLFGKIRVIFFHSSKRFASTFHELHCSFLQNIRRFLKTSISFFLLVNNMNEQTPLRLAPTSCSMRSRRVFYRSASKEL